MKSPWMRRSAPETVDMLLSGSGPHDGSKQGEPVRVSVVSEEG